MLETLWNRYESILLIMEMNLEKKSSEIFIFFLSKIDFEKKVEIFLKFFIFSMGNLDFPYKIFDKKKMKIFDDFFSKFISIIRRIDL